MYCSHCGQNNTSNAKYCINCGVHLKEENLTQGSFLDHGRYEINRLIKSGGMGSVYLVYDNRLGSKCALKEMIDFSPTPQERKKSVLRFENEVAILSKLSHPSLPKVTNYFTEGGHYYLIMDYIEGDDLDSILIDKGKPGLTEDYVRNVGTEVCGVLIYLHGQNPPILNRDIKPSNIMEEKGSGKIYLIDFGIAKAIAPQSYKKTAIGTEGYAPIEQYRGYPEPRSDIYALGATMYHLLTGVELKPFDLPPVRQINPSVSREMESILIKALNIYPDGRFANAREMLQALQVPEKCNENKISLIEAINPLKTHGKKPQLSIEKILFGFEFKKGKKTGVSRHPSVIKAKDGMEMILIGAGEFIMGTHIDDKFGSSASRDEMPAHRINLKDYYIDKYPVTNRQFLKFVNETGYKTKAELLGNLENWRTFFEEGKEEHPVVCVTWFDAQEYALWAEKELPTEAEWEKAARGVDGRAWPWGNYFDPGFLNSQESGIVTTTEVFRYDNGISPYGVFDMAGNVREWTIDWYRPYPFKGAYKTGYLKSIRGGSFSDKGIDNRCAKRWENVPSNRDNIKGFRCVKIPE